MRNFFRFIFIVLLIFEFANAIGWLSFSIDFTWLGLLISGGFVLALLEIISFIVCRRSAKLLPSHLWFLAFLMIGVDVFGDFFHLYSRFFWYDQIAHFFGATLVASMMLSTLTFIQEVYVLAVPRLLRLILAQTLTVSFSVLYEVEEYLEDLFYNTNRLGDSPDTVEDLLMGFFGALFGVLVTELIYQGRKNKWNIY